MRRTVLLLAAVLAGGCGALTGETPTTAAGVTVPAQRTTLRLSVPAKGELESLSASPIAVPRVPTGALKVKELIPEGSIIEPGEIVIVFDDTQLNIELSNHEASFRSTGRRIDRTQLQSNIEEGSIEVMREVARLELENAESFQVVDDEIYSQLEILETTVKKDEAAETIVFAEASLLLRGEYYDIEERILDVEKRQVAGKIDRVETSLASLVLRSPIGGLVVYKKNWRGGSVSVGDSLWPGNVVMQIVDPTKTALRAFVQEKDAAGIEIGLEAEIRVDANPRRAFRGTISQIAEISRPIAQGSPVKYFEVQIEVADPDPELLKPGMKGEARIFTGEIAEAVVVPRSAVRGKPEQHYVLLESASGGERRPVELGPGNQVVVSIASGLEGGESVLLGGDVEESPPEPSS